jgi:hypothetical protein
MAAVPIRVPDPASVSIEVPTLSSLTSRRSCRSARPCAAWRRPGADGGSGNDARRARADDADDVDAAVVEARFAELEQRVEQGVSRAVEAIATMAEGYLDPDRGALREMLHEVETSLGATLDPTSRASKRAKFEALLTGGTVETEVRPGAISGRRVRAKSLGGR